MTPGLEALIHPHPVPDLLSALARNEPVAVHGVHDSMAELFAIPFLSSLEALLCSWPESVQVHLPDVADEASSISASPQDARKLFGTGMGLLFEEAHRYAPRLPIWLDAIRRDLGLSALTQQRCLVYATPEDGGTAPHFDQNINVVVQVHGTKTWTLARNTNVVRPLTRHTMGLGVDPELASYATLPMPLEMPADRTEIVLERGSVLVVPRGVWHSTRASTDALALNFTFSPPTWIDLFTAALRSRLALSSEWRETAAPKSAATFEALLRELAAEAPGWCATDILEVTEPD